jgi:hypothetical protein
MLALDLKASAIVVEFDYFELCEISNSLQFPFLVNLSPTLNNFFGSNGPFENRLPTKQQGQYLVESLL